MGWFNYYTLLKKYDGDLSKASKRELDFAEHCNPENPYDARALAEKKWKVEHEKQTAQVSR